MAEPALKLRIVKNLEEELEELDSYMRLLEKEMRKGAPNMESIGNFRNRIYNLIESINNNLSNVKSRLNFLEKRFRKVEKEIEQWPLH